MKQIKSLKSTQGKIRAILKARVVNGTIFQLSDLRRLVFQYYSCFEGVDDLYHSIRGALDFLKDKGAIDKINSNIKDGWYIVKNVDLI